MQHIILHFYSEFIEKHKNIILIIGCMILILMIAIRKYIDLLNLTLLVVCLILLFEDYNDFLFFHAKKIIIIFVTTTICLSFACYWYYDTFEYLYFIKAYLQCVVFKTNDISVLTRSPYDLNDSNNPIHFDKYVDYYDRYMITSQKSVDDEMKLVKKIIKDMEGYRHFYNDKYFVGLWGGEEIVTITRYKNFTIVKYMVDA